jgi:hypothetical protein
MRARAPVSTLKESLADPRNPTKKWRRLLPVRASANLSPPLAVRASASSNSR